MSQHNIVLKKTKEKKYIFENLINLPFLYYILICYFNRFSTTPDHQNIPWGYPKSDLFPNFRRTNKNVKNLFETCFQAT